jgi:carbon-monoxide dehydrogenase small subunit
MAVDGAAVDTADGFVSDPIMQQLRVAFAEHHALQCGYCTPGMLMTGYDLVLRLKTPDETRIRRELSGNLCRCTGYVGIVAAIQSVIAMRGTSSDAAPARAVARSHEHDDEPVN